MRTGRRESRDRDRNIRFVNLGGVGNGAYRILSTALKETRVGWCLKPNNTGSSVIGWFGYRPGCFFNTERSPFCITPSAKDHCQIRPKRCHRPSCNILKKAKLRSSRIHLPLAVFFQRMHMQKIGSLACLKISLSSSPSLSMLIDE